MIRRQAVDLLCQPFCSLADLAPGGLIHTDSERLKAVRMQLGHGVRETEASVRFEVVFLAPDGTEERLPLEQADQYPFESVPPIRSFPSFRGQRNNTGWWWTATTGSHVGVESWLERDLLIGFGFDFDPTVTGIASQPFWLLWHEDGRERRHAPDFFLRHGCGTGSVIDCRPADRIGPRDESVFATAARARRIPAAVTGGRTK